MPLELDKAIDSSDYAVKEEFFLPSTIETIDAALTNFVRDELSIFCTTHEGWKRTPVIWTSAERSFQIKSNKDLRDDNGVLVKPVITIERAAITKDLAKKGAIFADVPPVGDEKRGTITIARQIKQDKTSNFANADAKRKFKQINFKTGKPTNKVVYETITIPLPIYIEVTYKVGLHAEYQQQINEMIAPFIVAGGGINYRIIKSVEGDHSYEVFIQGGFSSSNNVSSLSSEERKFQTDIEIKVLGYIIEADKK